MVCSSSWSEVLTLLRAREQQNPTLARSDQGRRERRVTSDLKETKNQKDLDGDTGFCLSLSFQTFLYIGLVFGLNFR